jgi:hypothetical protein
MDLRWTCFGTEAGLSWGPVWYLHCRGAGATGPQDQGRSRPNTIPSIDPRFPGTLLYLQQLRFSR